MFEILFGWRKASRCKRLIRRVQCRLKLLKNKSYSIVRQLREDVAQLIKTGYEEIALDRAEQLYKDESVMAVYELLDHFCEFILAHLSYIRRHRDCPNDINEAVSSLVYASARCGNLPELRAIRKLFGERYGDSFIKGALELYPGNLVNCEIRDKLSIKSVSEDTKLRMVDEIMRDHCFQPEILALEYASELQREMKEIMDPHVVDPNAQLFPGRIEGSKSEESGTDQVVETKSILVDPVKTGTDLTTTPMNSSLGYEESRMTVTIHIAPERKEKVTVISPSSSFGNSPRFYREKVVYLDDVEEVRSSAPPKENMNSQDQRMFKFKPLPVPRIETPEEEDNYLEESDSCDEIPVDKSSRRSKMGSDGRIRTRSVSRDNQGLESVEFVTYYNGPNENLNQQRNEDSKKLEQSAEHPTNMCCNLKDCSLDNPCYSHVPDEKDNPGAVTKKQSVPELVKLVSALPMKQERICGESVAVVYDVFTYPSYEPRKRSTAMTAREDDGSASDTDSSSSREDEHGLPPYLRAMTMPPERPKEAQSEKIPRSDSCPIQYPNHVHPKLPDYDEIAAKFSALKKEYLLQTKVC